MAPAEVLSNHGRARKPQRHHWQEEPLPSTRADPKSRLRRRTEVSDDPIDDQDVDKKQDELGAGGYAHPQQRSPNFHLGAPLRKAEAQIMIFFLARPHDE